MSENLPTIGSLISSDVFNDFKNTLDAFNSDAGRIITLNLKPTKTDCPNCSFDFAIQSSNRKYNSSNPNALNGSLNKSFLDGQRCPVCENKGFLMTSRTEQYTALISKKLKEEEVLSYNIVNKNAAKTHTVIESFSNILECETAVIDGELYKRVAAPVRTGFKNLVRVKTIWVRSD